MSQETAVVKYNETRGLLEKAKNQIKKALPKHIPIDRMIRVVLTATRLNPKLLDCNPESFMAAVFESAQVGLIPDGVLGEAYLIPYKTQCKLIPGYKGLVKLARQSGEIKDIYVHMVYSKETFVYRAGLERCLEHIPLGPGERGDTITGGYAVAEWRNGDKSWAWMWVEEIDAIRDVVLDKMQNPQASPWVQHYGEMAKKTVIRRLAKLLPLSPEFQRAAVIEDYPEAMGDDVIDLSTFPAPTKETEEGEDELLAELLEALEEIQGLNAETTDALDKFIHETAVANGITRSNLITQAIGKVGNFWTSFQQWQEKQAQDASAAPGSTQGQTQGGSRPRTDKERDALVDEAIRKVLADGVVDEKGNPDLKEVRSHLSNMKVADKTIQARWASASRPPEPTATPIDGQAAARRGRIKAGVIAHSQEIAEYDALASGEAVLEDGEPMPLRPPFLFLYLKRIVPDITEAEAAAAEAEVRAEATKE